MEDDPGQAAAPKLETGKVREQKGSSDSLRGGLVQAGPLAGAGLLANGAGVIVTVALARFLSTRGYGVLNQLTGVFLVVSMPGSAVIVAVVRRVAAWRGAGQLEKTRAWVGKAHRLATVVLGVFVVIVLATGPWIEHALNEHSVVGIEAMLAAGGVWVLLCFDRGLLQAHHDYRSLSVNLLVEGGSRAVLMVLLVACHLGPAGAALGVMFAECVTALHARRVADRVWAQEEKDDAHGGVRSGEAPPGRRHILIDFLFAFAALATLAFLQNVDVLIMGRENPGQSGAYAAVSVAAKALVFAAIVLGAYLLPEATVRWRRGTHALRQLAVTLSLLAIPVLLLLGIALTVPRFFLDTVFSHRYTGAVPALLPLALAMTCLGTTVLLSLYLLAIGRRWITGVLLVGAIACALAVVSEHGRTTGTARIDLLVQGILLVVVGTGFVWVHRGRWGKSVLAMDQVALSG